MKKEEFYNVLNHIDDSYILEARQEPKTVIPLWSIKAAFAMAACFCVVLASILAFHYTGSSQPHPAQVQCPNPLLEVESLSEMERYLDFKIPVLDREVKTYIVFVDESYPTMGRIVYADGSVFSMKFGTGDISGIYGGKLAKTETVGTAAVSFFTYTSVKGVEISYATWENGGFSYSLSEESVSFEQLSRDVQTLMG